MPKRLFKILEIIGLIAIIYILYKVSPFIILVSGKLLKIIFPFLIGFSFAFIVEPIILKLEKHRIKRKISVFIITIIIILILFVVFRFGIPLLMDELIKMLEMIPQYFSKLEEFITLVNNKMKGSIYIDFNNINQFITKKISILIPKITKILQQNFSYIIQLLVTPVLMVYFMIYYPEIETKIKEKLTEKNMNLTYQTLTKIKQVLKEYFKGIILVMILLALITGVSFMIIGLEYSLILGLIVGITDIIPYIGPYIGGGIVILFTLVTKPNLVLFVLVIILVVQFLEGNLLTPKIQSKKMNMNPIIVIFSVVFFGEILGIFGMIIAVPLAKIFQIVAQSWLTYKKTQKKR